MSFQGWVFPRCRKVGGVIATSVLGRVKGYGLCVPPKGVMMVRRIPNPHQVVLTPLRPHAHVPFLAGDDQADNRQRLLTGTPSPQRRSEILTWNEGTGPGG